MGFSLDIVPPGTEEDNSSTAAASTADPTQLIVIDRNQQNNNNNDENSEREEGEIIENLEYEDISSDEEINLRQRIEELEARNLEYEKIATISTAGKACDFDYGISNFVDLVDSSSDNDPITDTNNYSTNYIYNGSRYQNYHHHHQHHRSITTHKKSSRRKKDKQGGSSNAAGKSVGSLTSTSHHKHDRKKSRHSTNTNSSNNCSSSNKHKYSSNLNTNANTNTTAANIDDDYVYGNSNKSYYRTSNKSRNHTIHLNSSSDDNDDYENDYYYLKDDSYLSTSAKDDFRPRRNVLRAALKGSLSVTNNDNSSSLLKKLRGVQNCVKEFIKIKSKEDHDKEETATSIEIMQLLNTLTDENLLNGKQTSNKQQQIIIDDSQDDLENENDDDDDDGVDDDYNDVDVVVSGKNKYKSSSPLPQLLSQPPPPPLIRPSVNETISLEEQELRLIALKSAILKKHEQRKKRKIIEQQRPYSPTDTDNFINLLDSSSKIDLTNNQQHNEDNFKIAQIENMDISPAVSPVYTIDMSLQPIDMDLASSSDDGGDDLDNTLLKTSPQPQPEISSLQSQQQQQHQHQIIPNNNNTTWDIMTILPPPPPPPPLPPLPLLNDIQSLNVTEHQPSRSSSSFSQKNLFQSSLSSTIIPSNSSLSPPPPAPPIIKNTKTNNIIDRDENNEINADDDDEEENALRQLLLTTTRSSKIRKIDISDKRPNPKLQTEKLIIEDEQKTLDISLEAEELRKLLLKSLSNKKDEQKENVARINNIPTEQIKDISTLKDHQMLQNKKVISSSSSCSITNNHSTITTATKVPVSNTITITKKLFPLNNQKDNKQIVSSNNTTTTTTIAIATKPVAGQKRLAPTSQSQTNLLTIKKPKIIDIKQNHCKKSKIITCLEVKTVPKMIIRLDNSDSDTDYDDDDISDDECVDSSYFDNASPVSLSMDSPAYSEPASPSPLNTPNENATINMVQSTDGTGDDLTKSTNDLSTATIFQQQLDKFLKIARTKVEKTKITSTTVPNKPSNILKKNILITKSSKIITIPKTPQVVQHLPFSSQIEYHRLINRMSLLEKQKKAKLKITTAAATATVAKQKKIYVKNITDVNTTETNTFQIPSDSNAANVTDKDNLYNNKNLTIAIVNNNRIVEEKTELAEEISAKNINEQISNEYTSVADASTNKPIEKSPEIDKPKKTVKKQEDIIKTKATVINKLSSSSTLSIDPTNLNENDRIELLTKSESQYSDQSSTFLNDLDTMYKLVNTAQKTRTNIFHLEGEKEELLLKLKKLDENLNKEKKYLSKLYPTISGSHKDILRDRTKCIQLSNNCLTMGKLLHGSGYKIPHDKRDILLEKMKKISEATKKLKTMNKNDSKMIVISDVNVKKENTDNLVKTNEKKLELSESPEQVKIAQKEVKEIMVPIKEIQNNGDFNVETTTTQTTEILLSADPLANNHHPRQPDNDDDEVIDDLTTGLSTYKSPLDYKQQSSSANPNGVICPFQLMGQCEDKDCRYEHIPTAADNNDYDDGYAKITKTTKPSL